MRVLALVLALGAVACAACVATLGPEGVAARTTLADPAPGVEAREVGEFERVRVEGRLAVELRVGQPTRVRVRGDAERLAEVVVEVRDSTLILTLAPSRPWRSVPRVFVDTPEVRAIVAAGSGWVAASGLDQDELDVRVEGSADVALRGRVRDLCATSIGSGRIDTAGLERR